MYFVLSKVIPLECGGGKMQHCAVIVSDGLSSLKHAIACLFYLIHEEWNPRRRFKGEKTRRDLTFDLVEIYFLFYVINTIYCLAHIHRESSKEESSSWRN